MNVRLITAFGILSLLAVCLSCSSFAQDKYDEAYNLAKENKYAEAIPLLEEHCNKYPKDPRGGYLLAQSYIKTKQVDKAVKRLEVVLEHHPEDDKSQFLMGTALQVQKNTEKALTHFAEAAKAKPENGTYQYYYGSALLQMKKLPEAGEALEKAIKATPNDPKSNLDYGRLLVLTGDTEKALSHLQIAAKAEATKSIALPYLGVVQLQLKKYDDAVTTLTQATAADKTDSKLFFNLGQAYEAKVGDQGKNPDDYKNAISAYESALKLDAQNADIHFRLGKAFELAGTTIYESGHADQAVGQKAIELFEKSKAAYTSAVKIDPESAAKARIPSIDDRLKSLKNPETVEESAGN